MSRGGVALAALALFATACSDDSSSTPSSPLPPVTLGVVDSSVSADAATTTATTTTVSPPALDAAAALDLGLAAIVDGYHFASVVTVNGTQSLAAEGDRVGGSSRLLLTGEGGTVAYVITPEGSYAQPEGGDWSLLDVAPATSDPITALHAPVAVTTVTTTEGTTTLQVTVNAASLGITVEGNVDVQVTLVNGAISQISYVTPVDGGTAQVVTTLGPVVDPTPIAAPI